VVPEWAPWFIRELTQRKSLTSLLGLGCSPVLVKGNKQRSRSASLHGNLRAARKDHVTEPADNACSEARVTKRIRRRPWASPLLFGRFLMSVGCVYFAGGSTDWVRECYFLTSWNARICLQARMDGSWSRAASPRRQNCGRVAANSPNPLLYAHFSASKPKPSEHLTDTLTYLTKQR
jgi:hypothetical protein